MTVKRVLWTYCCNYYLRGLSKRCIAPFMTLEAAQSAFIYRAMKAMWSVRYLLKRSGSRRVWVEGGVLWRGRVLVFRCFLVIRLLGVVRERLSTTVTFTLQSLRQINKNSDVDLRLSEMHFDSFIVLFYLPMPRVRSQTNEVICL